MNLIKSSFWTGVSTSIKLLSGFIINKMIAINIGSSGLAIIGQFRDFIGILLSFATGGIQQGVVKYTAEYKTDKEKLKKLLSTSLLVNIFCSLFTGLFILIFRKSFSIKIFQSQEYDNIFLVFAFTIILFSLNTFFFSILNGFKEIKKFVYANITSNLIGLSVTSLLIYYYQLEGALLSLAIYQSITIFGTLFFLKSSDWFNFQYFTKGIDTNILRKLSQYSLMSIVSGLTLPFSLIIVRKYIGSHLSWAEAGYWEGIWRLSEMYLLLLSTSLGVYLLPTFSSLNGTRLKKEVFNAWKFVAPVSISIAALIFFFKDWITVILFSKGFQPMSKLFLYQLIGDVVKINGWVLGNLILAKSHTKTIILIDISWSILFVVLSILFINIWGLEGVTIAFLVNYICYFLFMNFYFRKLLWLK